MRVPLPATDADGESDPGREVRRAWLATALGCLLVGVLLLVAAHAVVTSLLGLASLLSVATAVAAARVGYRRGREVSQAAGRHELPPPASQAVIMVALLVAATAVLAAAGVLAQG